MKLPDNNAAFFFELETSLHMTHIRNSPDAVSALLADDFVEFGRSGKVWDKCSIMESMQREKVDQKVTVKEFAARELAPDVVLVTYKTASALRSSIWKRLGGKWQMIFHQGTGTSE
jgi:hypothetical protein